jgi:catechol 2,3-dioxygenase-like lactoylglutathione lyase family enzyme
MIQHVSRVVAMSDIEPCIHFYGLLGFAEVPAPSELAGRVRWLELAPAARLGHPTQLHLLIDEKAQPEQGHFAIVADPYGPTLARLRNAGYPPERRTPYWGAERSHVRDPAGNLVELMARAPA